MNGMYGREEGGCRHVVESILGAAVIVGGVLGFIVLMAWGGGYPGFNKWWLTHVVAPTYATVTVLVAGIWICFDASRRRGMKRGVGLNNE